MAAVPLIASFLPASQRTQTAKSRTAWQAYVATEAGAMHDRCLAQREAHPDTVITPEEALIIVRPLLDPACSLFPVISGPRLARFWLSLQEGDAAKEDILQFFIAAASGEPAFHEAVSAIVIGHMRSRQPLGDDLIRWTASALTGAKPAGPSGRPKETTRDRNIFAAVLVLQHLGLSPTKAPTRAVASDKERSGCGIVADVLGLSPTAVATVWTDRRHQLRDAGLLDSGLRKNLGDVPRAITGPS